MAKGTWAFLQEWAVYEYLMTRFEEGTLRLKQVLARGVPVGRERWAGVSHLEPIRDTQFPDVKSITLVGEGGPRPAEVKFRTSEFRYHKDDAKAFQGFQSRRGFILVLAHDHLPKGLPPAAVDVYELERPDFETWCRANLVRLFNRQLGIRAEPRIWIMYQGPNFNMGSDSIKPARQSHIWCPTENLTGFDLAPGDRVVFVKTAGASQQSVQSQYLKGEIHETWFLEELYIAEVVSKILSREEYCHLTKIPYGTQLWSKDPRRDEAWRWGRVFRFRPIARISPRLRLKDMSSRGSVEPLVDEIAQAYCYGKSRELDLREYTVSLERLHKRLSRV